MTSFLHHPSALGSRLRRLTEAITGEAASIYALYQIPLRPKWFPVYAALAEQGRLSIVSLAREIGHTHPSVCRIVREMSAAGLVEEARDAQDMRRTMVQLTEAGRALLPSMKEALEDVASATDQLMQETRHNLWRALEEWEERLQGRSLRERTVEQRRARLRRQLRIRPWQEGDEEAFYRLNEQWISAHWELEEHDREVLSHPEHLLEEGGQIFAATLGERVIGVCALVRLHEGPWTHELAKLAVSPEAQGLGAGRALCEAVIDAARADGCKRLFLESNTGLRPAIHLYRSLGFQEVEDTHPHYARGDIQMTLPLA